MEPVFVETVVNEITILAVPLSPIIESEKFDELELSSHIVSHSCSFSALLSFDTHSPHWLPLSCLRRWNRLPLPWSSD
jgi:hypothetical protein